jgi:UDP-N-acetylmuramate dehydrogenase
MSRDPVRSVPSLSELTTLRLGGPPARLVTIESDDALVEAVRAADERAEPLLLLAGGSNVVVADAGFDGTVARVATRGVERFRMADGRVRLDVAAGEDWDALVAACVADGLAGIEALSGIPGSVGATPIQNVGAYGQEVADVLIGVRALDRSTGALHDLGIEECLFDYRSSVFKRDPGRWVVLGISFALEPTGLSEPIRYAELAARLGVAIGDRAPVGEVREAVLALRRGKGMVLDPADPDTISAGSFFTNPILRARDYDAFAERAAQHAGAGVRPPAWPIDSRSVKTSAAWLIERAGFHRGYGNPHGIAISSKHTLALTNRGAGTTGELVALAREIAAGVHKAFGVDLVPEPVFVGHAW